MNDFQNVRNDIETLKVLISKENLSLSETLELFKLRSFYLKNYGITSEDLKYLSTDELVERIKSINEKISQVNIPNVRLSLDDIFKDTETELTNDFRQVLRKNLLQKVVEIRKGHKDVSLTLTEDKIILNLPKDTDIQIQDKSQKKNEEDITDIIDFKDNKKIEIIEVDETPILKFTGKRYRVFKHSLDDVNKEFLKNVVNKLKELFDENKYIMYFMKIFGISSRKDAKKILEELSSNQ